MFKKRKPLYYAVSAFAIGLTLTLLSLYLDQRAATINQEKLPYIQLGKSLAEAANAASSQLGTEGMVDPATHQSLQQGRKSIQDAFDIKSNEWGSFNDTNESLLLQLRSVALELDEALHALTTIQDLKKNAVEEGVAAQISITTSALSKVSLTLSTVVKDKEEELKSTSQTLAVLFRIISALMLIAFVGLSIFIYRIQLNREVTEEETAAKLAREGERMQHLTGFIEAVSNGNFDIQLNAEGKEDHVMETLVRMREKLKENAELERKRNWTTSGVAQIGEILRATTSSAELFDSIIKFIVKYTRSNQGGLFILNDDDNQHAFLELTACYAFERKRYLTKKVNIGDGLIGQCFLEKEKTYLQEIPESYVNITSGLGGANPRSVLVVPLKVNEEVYGVIELASFQNYEPHEIDLIEKFAESIASTVSSVKVNERTRELLEQTQQQAEEMKSQEEEMRQNMEELSATQEQLQRQMSEAEAAKDELTQHNYVFGINTILSESDLFGTITFANDKLTQVSKYSREELIGKGHNIFRHPDMPRAIFKLMWDTIQRGEVFSGIVKNRAKDGTHYWVDATIVPIKDKAGQITKYISARYHITNDRMAEAMYAKQLEKLGLANPEMAS